MIESKLSKVLIRTNYLVQKLANVNPCRFSTSRSVTSSVFKLPQKHKFHNNRLNNRELKRTSCHGTHTRTMTYKPEPEIIVKPSGHLLVDNDLTIKVNGLKKDEHVTLYATLEEDNKSYESYGWFIADKDGVVDLQKHPSTSGTYSGISSMGMFWSMVPAPGQMKGIRMMKKDMDTPFTTHMHVYNGHVSPDFIRENKTTSRLSHLIERWYKAPDVTYHDVTDGRVRGRLFMPTGQGPFPGVIDLFGSVGGLTEYRSALLASRGFASLALPYFDYQDLPKNLPDVDLDYFIEAVDWLLSRDKVYSEGVGVVGTSKGGDIALLMGAHCPKVKAIVNVNGATFSATYGMKYSGGDIPGVEMNFAKLKEVDGAYLLNSTFDYDVSDLIPVWNNDAKVLNILCEDDMCNPKGCIRLMQSVFPAEKADNFTILAYPGAGHLLEPPYTPLCNMSYHKAYSISFWWGGNPRDHAYAQEDGWRKLQAFLREHIPVPKTNFKHVSKL